MHGKGRENCPVDNEQRMHAGLIYNPGTVSLGTRQSEALEKLYDFNTTRPSDGERRSVLLKEMFAAIGPGCYIEPPFHANWGGAHVHFGKNVYANFNLTLVDDGPIHVGDNVMFGPGVTITTAGHPILPELRQLGAQFNLPVNIGKNVWIGAGALIMPGVSIGENSVIGAGSIVTKDIPAHVVAFGTPCRVIRNIGAHDHEYYWRDRKIDITIEEF